MIQLSALTVLGFYEKIYIYIYYIVYFVDVTVGLIFPLDARLYLLAVLCAGECAL